MCLYPRDWHSRSGDPPQSVPQGPGLPRPGPPAPGSPLRGGLTWKVRATNQWLDKEGWSLAAGHCSGAAEGLAKQNKPLCLQHCSFFQDIQESSILPIIPPQRLSTSLDDTHNKSLPSFVGDSVFWLRNPVQFLLNNLSIAILIFQNGSWASEYLARLQVVLDEEV